MSTLLWPHRTGTATCADCGRRLLYHDPVNDQMGTLRHEWCAKPVDNSAPNVDNPRYDSDGMVLWSGNRYDPARALEIEPGLTPAELLSYAPKAR